jgi:hypothetical protein
MSLANHKHTNTLNTTINNFFISAPLIRILVRYGT